MFEESILLECRCTADPVPSFTWTLDGKAITVGNKYKQGLVKQRINERTKGKIIVYIDLEFFRKEIHMLSFWNFRKCQKPTREIIKLQPKMSKAMVQQIFN